MKIITKNFECPEDRKARLHLQDERSRKNNRIKELYADRKNTQQDVADISDIPVSVVGRVCRKGNFHRTREITEKDHGRYKINMIVTSESLRFLDKYNI